MNILTTNACVLLQLGFVTVVATGAPKALRDEVAKQLVGKVVSCRPSPNVSLTYYVRLGTDECFLRHKPSGIYPVPHKIENTTITKVALDEEVEVLSWKVNTERAHHVRVPDAREIREILVFSLRHPHLGRGEVRLTTASGKLPASADLVYKALSFCFTGDFFNDPVLYRGNRQSKLLHFEASGHSPSELDGQPFRTIEEATKNGYRSCALCFNGRLNLADLDDELLLGRETEANLRRYWKASTNAAHKSLVEAAGRRVLAHWPTRLKGYTYRFDVLESHDFNAVSCAGGSIFVYSGLLDDLDSPDELEAILAHEIAHVEQRHALNELKKRIRDANAAAIAAAIVGGAAGVAAASANNSNAGVIAEGAAVVTFVLAQTAARISASGYSKEHEKEADLYALMYLKRGGKGAEPLLSVLRKLRTVQDMLYDRDGDAISGDSHPAAKDRIFIIQNAQYDATFGVVFDGVNKAGELLYSISFDGLCSYKQRDGRVVSKLLTQVQTTSALGKSAEIKSLTLRNENNFQDFHTDGPVGVVPLDRIGVSFTRLRGEKVVLDDTTIRLEGISADKVLRRSSE